MRIGITIGINAGGRKGPPPIPGPVNSVAPAITGTAAVGSVLTVSNGTWSGTPTYARQWYVDGIAVIGQTATTYTLDAADEGKTVYAIVTATGADTGVSTAASNTVGPVAAAPVGPTYADFVAHITAKAVDGTTNFIGYVDAGKRRTTAGGGYQSSGLYGTSWLGYFEQASTQVAGVIWHGLPSEAEFLAQVAAGRQIYYELSGNISVGSYAGRTRNGMTTVGANDDGDEETNYGTRQMIDLIYWDGASPQRMNPSTGTGPTPYTWP